MKLLTLITLTVLLWAPFLSAQKLIDLKNTEGKNIAVLIDNYLPEKNQVYVRINGEGRVVNFGMDLLDKPSQEKVIEWYQKLAVTKLIRYRIQRVPGEEIGYSRFEIQLVSSSNEDVKDVKMSYQIPYKEYEMIEKKNSNNNSGGGKSKKKIYEKISQEMVVTGDIDVGILKARETTTLYTKDIQTTKIQNLQDDDKGSGKGRTETLYNTAFGMVLEVYIDGELVHEEESQPGMIALVENYGG